MIRYRPSFDALEDRLVLSPVTFNEVQNQSILALSGTIAGRKIKPQGPGALTTTYFGTFQTNIDEANGAISFMETGNDFCAANTGNWAPLADGSTGTAPAIYGVRVNIHHMAMLAAIRDFHMNADTGGTALPLYQNDDGSFGFPSAQTITISAASGTYAHPALGQGPLNFSGLNAPNQAGDGTLVDNGHGGLVITIPISVSMSGTLNGLNFTLNINGQIVGTATYTGPSSSGHSLSDVTIGAALVSSTHSLGVAALVTTGSHSQEQASASPGDVAMTLAETSSLVQDVRAGDVMAPLVHHVRPMAFDQITTLDAVFQELA